MNKRNLVLSMVAGLAGGALASYCGSVFRPEVAHAQSPATEEIRAQRFTLVNQEGVALGSFSFDDVGRPQIILRDRFGHDAWRLVGDHVETHMTSNRYQGK